MMLSRRVAFVGCLSQPSHFSVVCLFEQIGQPRTFASQFAYRNWHVTKSTTEA